MRTKQTALNLSKTVLLDLLETLNEMDVLISKGRGTAAVQKDILTYQQLLETTLRPLL